MTQERKHTKFQTCERHAGWFAGETRYRKAEVFAEGGPGGMAGCCGGTCRIWPGRDFFVAELCGGEMALDWAVPIPERLEYLRGEIQAERISYGEIAELQGLVPYIEPGDFELLEWAGVPEDEAMARLYGAPAGGTS